MKKSIITMLGLVLILSLLLAACAAKPTEAPAAPPAPENPDVILATDRLQHQDGGGGDRRSLADG